MKVYIAGRTEARMKVYIAGPMSGIDDYNFSAFNAAEFRWRQYGWEVENPAHPEWVGKTWEECMTLCLPILFSCDAIAMLPGWENSRGARIERAVAEVLGMREFHAHIPVHVPVTDHLYREGSYNAGKMIECCNQPDYMHMPLWKTALTNTRS